MEILFDKEYCIITYEKDKNLISLVWKRIISSEEYRRGFEVLKNIILEKQIKRLLTDSRNQGIISPDDRKWLETKVIPVAIKGGLKYVATVLAKDVFKQYYLTKIQSKSKKSGMSEFEIFESIQKAKEWLLNTNID